MNGVFERFFFFHLSFYLAEPPTANVTPSILTQMNGTDATVVCTVSGNPIPELRWNTNLTTISEVIISPVDTCNVML